MKPIWISCVALILFTLPILTRSIAGPKASPTPASGPKITAEMQAGVYATQIIQQMTTLHQTVQTLLEQGAAGTTTQDGRTIPAVTADQVKKILGPDNVKRLEASRKSWQAP